MREIKFRAWDGKQMRCPSLINIGNTSPLYVCYTTDNLEPVWFEAKELMQFTGLKDKNGKEIYESDILVDKVSGVRWVVKFGNCKKYAFAGWYVENETIDRVSPLYGDYNGDTNSMVEIIGNIYESPELLTPQPQSFTQP